MATAAETIASWATGITLDDVPTDVVEHAKLHVLDVLGCGLAALTMACVNIFGGFLVTQRMLGMYQKKKK